MRHRDSLFDMSIILAFLLLHLMTISAIEFPDSDSDNATDDSVFLLTTTESPAPETDNGMTLGGIPDQVTNANDFDVTVGAKKLVEAYPPLDLPENHKNYSTPFVSAIELPPLLNQFNTYQQQYKDYYKQKSEYGLKPVKFETNAANNHYVGHGLSAHLEEDARHRYEELKYERQPFPYTYENERLPLLEQTSWAEHGEAAPLQNEVTVHYYQPEEHAIKEKGLDGWKKALKFFTALVPFGLLLASLTPSVISINSTVDQKPIRQRSLAEAEDFREFFKGEYNTDCDKKLVCELSRRGKEDTGTYMQKSFWYLANKIPDEVARELGMEKLFQTIRRGDCESYKCPKKITAKKVTKPRRKKIVGE